RHTRSKRDWSSDVCSSDLERGIVGASIGLGLAGCRNVAEIQFCDYAFNAIDLLKLGGMIHWSSNGDWNCPMTIMTPVGSGIRGRSEERRVGKEGRAGWGGK